MVEVYGVMHGQPFSVVVERSDLKATILSYQDAEQGPFPRPYSGPLPVAKPEVLVPQEPEFEEVPF